MITLSKPVDNPLLGALRKFFPNPRAENAISCLRVEEMQDLGIRAAEEARRLAAAEDDARLAVGKRTLLNYRRFYVGGVGIGLILSPWSHRTYEWVTFAAFNTKGSKKDKKCCAEMRIMKGARSSHWICIGGLVVVGELQPDGRSGVQGLALDPCEACRDMMRSPENRYLFRDRSLLLTAQPESQIRVLRSIPELMKTHNEEWPALSKK